jgi:hypothetical protein
MKDEGEHNLVIVNDGETKEEALKRWWDKNGLDPEEARRKRKETYMQQLKETAVKMERWRENSTTNQN